MASNNVSFSHTYICVGTPSSRKIDVLTYTCSHAVAKHRCHPRRPLPPVGLPHPPRPARLEPFGLCESVQP
eukprot:3304551-Prymnesium_polylepis.1